MFCQNCATAPVFVRIPGSHHPGTRLRLVPGFSDPGSVLILGQVTQYGNPYLICITIHFVKPRTACVLKNLVGIASGIHLSPVRWGLRPLEVGNKEHVFISYCNYVLFIISGTNLNDSRLAWWNTDRKNWTPYIKLAIYFYGSYASAATVMQCYYFDYRICAAVIIVYFRKRTLQWMCSSSLLNRFYRKSDSMIFVSCVRTKFRSVCFTNGGNWFSDRFPINPLNHLGLTSVHPGSLYTWLFTIQCNCTKIRDIKCNKYTFLWTLYDDDMVTLFYPSGTESGMYQNLVIAMLADLWWRQQELW